MMDQFSKRLKRVQGEPVVGDDCVITEEALVEAGDFSFEPVSGFAVSKRWIAKNVLGMTDEEYDNSVKLANAMYEEQQKDDDRLG